MPNEIKIEVDDEAVLRSLRKLPSALDKELKGSMLDAMSLVSREAKQNHRFTSRTHNLERSLTPEVDGLNGRVRIADELASYGKFIHKGFKSWAPDRFLYKALDRKKSEVTEIITRAVRKVLKAVF